MSPEADTKKELSWLELSMDENHGLFAEMDVLLKALDRFFIVENQPASRIPFTAKNLIKELDASRDAVKRILSILETVVPEVNRNAYWFQKFAESKLLNQKKRDIMRAGMYKQDTPEKSIYVLYDTCINLKSLIADILRTQDIQYQSFKNIGQIVSKELRENVYFNPFRLDINPKFDFIENREITDIVKGIKDPNAKKITSVLILHLFRLLRYLKVMDHRSLNPEAINCSLIVFALLKGEIEAFRGYIEQSGNKFNSKDLKMLITGLSYQFSMEAKRVFQQELKDIFDRESVIQQRGKIETSRGILKNLTEQTIIQIAKHFNPQLKGEEIFDVFITKTAQSMKLREDMYVLNRLISEGERAKDADRRTGVLTMLMNYMDYFENFTFKLLRYDDYEQFSAMFYKIRDGYQSGEDMKKLLEVCHAFNIYLDTTLRQIENRADLKDKPLDTEKAEDIIKQYLSNI